ncbi:unnamed protein product [Trichobilharzia szidati]|nr:unnamed protein product [Trichobilharzia szidati]
MNHNTSVSTEISAPNSDSVSVTHSASSITTTHQRPASSGNHLRRTLYHRRRDFSRKIKKKASRINRQTTKHEVKLVPWTPGDDYLLINSVVMVCNLTEVYHTVRFAVHYTEKEIEARWRDLLFDPIVSSTALKAIEKLPPFIKAQLDRQIPFTSQEDNIIAQISFLDVFPDGVLRPLTTYDLNPSIFTEVLRKYPSVFYIRRDAFDLYRQWCRFYSCHCIRPDEEKLETKTEEISSFLVNPSPSSSSTATTVGINSMNRDITLIPKDISLSTSIPLGEDPESFSDTELLLEETVANAVTAGISKLTEQSTVARRQRMLNQTSYHGFQGLVTQTILEALIKESLSNQSSDSGIQSSPISVSSQYSLLTSSGSRSTDLKSSAAFDQSCSAPQESSSKSHSSFIRQSSVPFISNEQEFNLNRRLELYRRRGRLWARLRRTKEEARRWTHLVERCITNGLEIMNPQPVYPVLATLTGSRTKYLIKEKKVIFGRSSLLYQPYIDLSYEGDSARVSRCHGQIRLADDGIFWLANFSSHAVYVDGNPILTDEEVELRDLATVLVSHITLRFDVNHHYVKWLCNNVAYDIDDDDDDNYNNNNDSNTNSSNDNNNNDGTLDEAVLGGGTVNDADDDANNNNNNDNNINDNNIDHHSSISTLDEIVVSGGTTTGINNDINNNNNTKGEVNTPEGL